MIHKSHSKKELCEMIKVFDIDIETPETLKKKQLVKKLELQLNVMDEIKPELDRFCFYNFIDMKHFLENVNPKKRLSIKEKNDVILKCRKIQQYIKNGYILNMTIFNNREEVYDLADTLLHGGDIPSVRRMCRELNKDPHSNRKFSASLSKQTKRELEIRTQLKEKYSKKLEVKYGEFILSFS
tara:strand:+ start:1223 stop:1771 length:549 start_codon:yes stop_codon:yes gene_type:complete